MRRFLTVFVVFACAAVALSPSSASAAKEPFDAWVAELAKDAKKRGIGQKGLSALEGVAPIPKVIELDRKQPEGTMTFERYLQIVVKEERIKEGRRLRAEHAELLEKVAAQHGVDPEFIVALWGVETSFGTITGDYPVVASLATLAHDGRRAKMFRAQLLDALRIIDQGHVSASEMKGSWAGAMGQCQFMPGTFLAYAFDQDGDGRKDIWGTLPDVFGSAANYLKKIGWKRGTGWGVEVVLPKGFDEKLVGRNTRKSADEWAKLGVKAKDGGALKAPAPASIVRPGGKTDRVFMIWGNYRVLLNWNRSEYFATGVSLLAEEIAKGDAGEAPSPAP